MNKLFFFLLASCRAHISNQQAEEGCVGEDTSSRPDVQVVYPVDSGDTAILDTGDTGTGPYLGVVLSDDCGFQVGDKACNLCLMDQNGDVFDLYSHEGKVIVLDFSATWCYWCQVAAAGVQATQDAYSPQLLYVTVLLQNSVGTDPTADDLTNWANTYGIEAPILSGGPHIVDYPDGLTGWSVSGIPSFYFIDQDMNVYDQLPGWSESALVSKIEEKVVTGGG